MTISNCTSTTSAYQTDASNGFRQRMQDFKSLADALQSGDVSSAQDAMTTLQNDLQNYQSNGKTSPLLDPNTTLGKDFQTLQDALKSGDLQSAQDAFNTLKQDVRKTHGGHHHHKVDNDGDGDDTNATTNTDSSTDSTGTTLNVTA